MKWGDEVGKRVLMGRGEKEVEAGMGVSHTCVSLLWQRVSRLLHTSRASSSYAGSSQACRRDSPESHQLIETHKMAGFLNQKQFAIK